MTYLDDALVKKTFLRLRQEKPGGKKGLERTSALMYFLAFESLVKKLGAVPPLDLNPDSPNGKHHRDVLAIEYQRLVQVGSIGSQPCHVINLGEVKTGLPTPESRISANFLTVPLKEATNSGQTYEYPSRPKPLLVLGQEATGVRWGIDRHPAWQENMPAFFEGRKTRTPFHDLSVFVLRQDNGFISNKPLQTALIAGLSKRFLPDLCDYWRIRLSLEKPYLPSISKPFQSSTPTVFSDLDWLGPQKEENQLSLFFARIEYLEGLLSLHGVPFEPRK